MACSSVSAVKSMNAHFSSRASCLLSCLVMMALVAEAHALVFYSTGDPNFNTTPPTGSLSDSGWQWQGAWGGFLGTPIAPHHFLTASHVGGSTNQLFRLNGVDYRTIAMFDDPETDLRIWQVDGTFPSFAPLYRGS